MPMIAMTVLRAGYWDGQYPRAGDTITVPEEHVQTLELAGFAVRQETAGAPLAAGAPVRLAKGSKHGR
jgi:hypothetical protein